MRIERALDGLADAAERNGSPEKGCDGDLVGGVEDRRRRAAGTPRRYAGQESRKHVGTHRLEGQWTGGDRVKPSDTGIGEPFRVSERVKDG